MNEKKLQASRMKSGDSVSWLDSLYKLKDKRKK